MSAEILRRAAALMRERAVTATAGRWLDFAAKPVDGPIFNGVGTERDPEVTICEIPRTPQGSMDADHIASWHPAVALAVADLLDAQAQFMEDGGDFSDIEGGGDANALAIALAYLGESA